MLCVHSLRTISGILLESALKAAAPLAADDNANDGGLAGHLFFTVEHAALAAANEALSPAS